jgi:hypothetical protein
VWDARPRPARLTVPATAQEYGPEGAEKLNLFISSYFDKLINVIHNFGGE